MGSGASTARSMLTTVTLAGIQRTRPRHESCRRGGSQFQPLVSRPETRTVIRTATAFLLYVETVAGSFATSLLHVHLLKPPNRLPACASRSPDSERCCVRVVPATVDGYGNNLIGGIAAAREKRHFRAFWCKREQNWPGPARGKPPGLKTGPCTLRLQNARLRVGI
jgi:hypothetical protein